MGCLTHLTSQKADEFALKEKRKALKKYSSWWTIILKVRGDGREVNSSVDHSFDDPSKNNMGEILVDERGITPIASENDSKL